MDIPNNRKTKTPEEKKQILEDQQKQFEELQKIYSNTFSTEAGMKVLKHIVRTANVFGVSSSVDADGKISVEKTFFKDGKRELALSILNLLPDNIVIKALGK